MHGTTSLADAHASTQGGPRTIFEGRSIAFRYAGSSRGRVSGGGPDPRVNMISCFVEHISWAMWTCSTSGLSFGFPCIAVLHTWGPWLAQLSGGLWSAPHCASTVSSPAHKPLPGFFVRGVAPGTASLAPPSCRSLRSHTFRQSVNFICKLPRTTDSINRTIHHLPFRGSGPTPLLLDAPRGVPRCARGTASYFRRRHVPPPYAMLSAALSKSTS